MASTKQIIVTKGKRGATGAAGIIGTDITNVSLSKVDNPISHVFLNNKLTETLKGAFTANTDPDNDMFFVDTYGGGQWIAPETLTNHAEWSNDSSKWQDILGNWTVNVLGTTDPDGGNESNRLQLSSDTRAASRVLTFDFDNTGAPSAKNWTITFWYKVDSGLIDSFDLRFDGIDYVLTTDTAADDVWKKITFVAPAQAGVPTALNSINPRGDFAAGFEVTFLNVSPNNAEIPHIKTLGAAVSASNANYKERQNNKGWYGDAAITNLALNSQDLSASTWSFPTLNATIQPYAGSSPEGITNEKVLLVADSTSDITLRCTNANLLDATNYIVSFYIFVTQGSHNEINVNVGGGSNVVTSSLADSIAFKRVTASVTSSSGGYLDINIVSPINGFKAVIWGVQCQSGQLGSYVRTGDVAVSRIADVLKCDFDNNAPLGSSNWSFVSEQNELYNVSNGATLYEADSTFKAVYSGSDLIVTNGTMNITLTGAISAIDVAVTFDGTNLKGYLNGVEVVTTSSGNASTGVYSELFLNKDLGGYMQNTKFYNSALNADEVQYLAGVY